MKEIIRPLDNAGLKKCKPSYIPFIFIFYCRNIMPHNIKPMIFFIGIINILEIVSYKCRIFNIGVFI